MTGMLGSSASSSNTITVPADPERTFSVIEDARSYPEWLVGAQRITAVDDDWPAKGSRFCHRIGCGPLSFPGSTTVRAIERPNELTLAAGMGVFGEAQVRFRLRQTDEGTELRLDETPTRGPARLAAALFKPVLSAVLWGRNAVSLGALPDLVAGTDPTRGDGVRGS